MSCNGNSLVSPSHLVTTVAHFSFEPLNKHNLFSHSEPSTKVNVLGNEDGQCAVADTHSFLGRPGAVSRTYNFAPRALPVQEQLEIGAHASRRLPSEERLGDSARVRDSGRHICLCSLLHFPSPGLLG